MPPVSGSKTLYTRDGWRSKLAKIAYSLHYNIYRNSSNAITRRAITNYILHEFPLKRYFRVEEDHAGRLQWRFFAISTKDAKNTTFSRTPKKGCFWREKSFAFFSLVDMAKNAIGAAPRGLPLPENTFLVSCSI